MITSASDLNQIAAISALGEFASTYDVDEQERVLSVGGHTIGGSGGVHSVGVPLSATNIGQEGNNLVASSTTASETTHSQGNVRVPFTTSIESASDSISQTDSQSTFGVLSPNSFEDGSQSSVGVPLPNSITGQSQSSVGVPLPNSISRQSQSSVGVPLPNSIGGQSQSSVGVPLPNSIEQISSVGVPLPHSFAEKSQLSVGVPLPNAISTDESFSVGFSSSSAENLNPDISNQNLADVLRDEGLTRTFQLLEDSNLLQQLSDDGIFTSMLN